MKSHKLAVMLLSLPDVEVITENSNHLLAIGDAFLRHLYHYREGNTRLLSPYEYYNYSTPNDPDLEMVQVIQIVT